MGPGHTETANVDSSSSTGAGQRQCCISCGKIGFLHLAPNPDGDAKTWAGAVLSAGDQRKNLGHKAAKSGPGLEGSALATGSSARPRAVVAREVLVAADCAPERVMAGRLRRARA